jgi:hypothetical protein
MPDETDQPTLISVNRGDAPVEPFPSPLDRWRSSSTFRSARAVCVADRPMNSIVGLFAHAKKKSPGLLELSG